MINVYARHRPGRPFHNDTEEILNLRKLGNSYNKISDYLGVARSTVQYICKRAGLNGKINGVFVEQSRELPVPFSYVQNQLKQEE